jgi:hypothetical protein
MVPMSMAMIVWWSMMRRPRFPVLFPALPIIFQRIRSRLSLPLRPIFARRSQRRQQKPRPDGPASRRRGASSRRGRSRRSSRWGYRAVFPRRRRDTPTAMSSSSRSALPSTISGSGFAAVAPDTLLAQELGPAHSPACSPSAGAVGAG